MNDSLDINDCKQPIKGAFYAIYLLINLLYALKVNKNKLQPAENNVIFASKIILNTFNFNKLIEFSRLIYNQV